MTLDEANMTINYLKEMQEGYIEGEGYERHPLPEWYALDKAIEAIEQTKWIPVSERLPLLRGSHKISDDVLITNGYEIDMGYLVERTGRIFWHYYGSDIEVVRDNDDDVTAWMPLPKPYKAESEE